MLKLMDIKLIFKTDSKSDATFDGALYAKGTLGYVFSGKLVASCLLDRSAKPFQNIVRLGHGSSSAEFTYLEYTLGNKIQKGTFEVKGEGKRKAKEKVDFCLGFNDGSDGKFVNGPKSSYDMEAAERKLINSEPEYEEEEETEPEIDVDEEEEDTEPDVDEEKG